MWTNNTWFYGWRRKGFPWRNEHNNDLPITQTHKCDLQASKLGLIQGLEPSYEGISTLTTHADKSFYLCKCQCIKWTTFSSMSDKVWCEYSSLSQIIVSDHDCWEINKIFTQTHKGQVIIKCGLFYIFKNRFCLVITVWNELTLGLSTVAQFLLVWSSLLVPWSNEFIQSIIDCMWMNLYVDSWNQHAYNPKVISWNLSNESKG